ncbi:MAG: alkaline phosphatase, partial [Bifidobacteriaceae bacterium]|nr:alkaline phosphatase [Bifidobacteriaceae bacterium]
MSLTLPKTARLICGFVVAAGLAVSASTALAGVFDLSLPGAANRQNGDQTDQLRQAVKAGRARNVILLIGDGMGDSEITIARNYAYGAAGKLPGIDALPLTGQYTTYSLKQDGTVDYVTDSAASGTGWATGVKSYDGAIGVDIRGHAQTSILEAAKAAGLRTGDVSTAEIQDATPAVQIAHVGSRRCYGPQTAAASCANAGAPNGSDLLENGGLGSISEQLLVTRPDVTLGGGAASFNQTAQAGAYAGQTLWQQAQQRGFQVAQNAADLQAITNIDQPVLGLFAPGNFPTRYNSVVATRNGGSQPAVTCTEQASWLGTNNSGLSLRDLTTKSIELLDDPSADKGFFLQVEGASIDKRDHAADACGQIGETIDLDEAVRAALDFAEQDGQTLVVVTADHAHTAQIIENGTSAGYTINLNTADNTVMTVSYATTDEGETPTGSQQHTGTQLRIAAYGPGGANMVGLSDQTDLFTNMMRVLGLDSAVELSSADATVDAPSTVLTDERFDITATNFKADDQIEVTHPDGSKTTARLVAGAATVTVKAPATAGSAEVAVKGLTSGEQRNVSLTVNQRPTVTVTEPGPTVTVPGPTTTVPGPTTTVPGPATTVPGPTVTAPGVTVQAPPVTIQVAGPTVQAPLSRQAVLAKSLFKGGKTKLTVKASQRATVQATLTSKSGTVFGGRLEVRWGSGEKQFKTVNVPTNGKVSFQLPKLKRGKYTISLTYLGNASLTSAKAKNIKLTVK